MGRELRTRYKIQDLVRVLEVTDDMSHWAVGCKGLIRQVVFDLFGISFIVEVCNPVTKMCCQIKTRKVKREKE